MPGRHESKFEYRVQLLSTMRRPVRMLLSANRVPRKDWDYYRLMLHWVTRGMMKSYKDTYIVTKNPPRSSEWFCRLYSKIMDGAMGHKYLEVIGNLVRWGVLVRGSAYCRGEDGLPGRCKAVWFTEEYSFMLRSYCFVKDVVHLFGKRGGKAGHLSTVELKSRVLLKRLERCAMERKRDQLLDPVVRDAHDNLLHFSVDRKKAREVLGEELTKDGRVDRKRLDAEMRKVDRFNGTAGSETSLFVVRDDYGRVHTNVTQMKKCVRMHAMTCDGGPVGAVDIRSSQGSFLCHILGAWLHGDTAVLGRNGRSFISVDAGYLDRVDRSGAEREYADFRSKLEGKELYETFAAMMSDDGELMEALEARDGRDPYLEPVTRDEAKKAFLATLFAGIELPVDCDPTWTACRNAWKRRWPNLLKLVDHMKRDNYRALAYEMQRMESSFVFDVVIPAVKSEIGCPYCTVHDEIIVPAGHAGAVKAIMDRELGRFGIPTVTKAEGDMLEPGDAVVRAEMPSCVEVGLGCDWGDRVELRVAEEYADAV
jgi:hypothetical protein